MRLTLRTLLAYLDDVLEPAQAKQLGEKLNESGFAAGLVSRIRDVMRRRRLTAPAVTGSGIGVDPNTVAEYLDNTLPPEAVADVEKVCLDSDVHLAEVAACHQILTLVLGEPVELNSETRDRMYALGPIVPERLTPAEEDTVEGLDPIRQPHHPQPVAAMVVPPPVEEPFAPQPAANTESFRNTLPEYLRSQTNWRRYLPYAVITVIAAMWLVSLFLDSPFSPSKKPAAQKTDASGSTVVAANERAAEGTEGTKRQVATAVSPAPATDIIPATPIDTRPVPNKTVLPSATEIATTEPPRPPAEPAPLPVPVEPEPTTAAKTSPREVATVTKTAAPPPAAEPPPSASSPMPMPPMPVAKYVSAEGVVVQFSPKDQKWFVMPHRTFVYGGDTLAIPEPFEAEMEIGEKQGTVTILGGTAARCLGPNAVAAYGWDLQRGRLIVRALRGSEEMKGPPFTIALNIRGELWGLELQTPETVCGIEMIPGTTNQFEQNLSKNAYAGGVYVTAGAVRLFHATLPEHLVAGPGWLPFPLPTTAAATVEMPPLLAVPAWLTQAMPTSLAKTQGKLFEKEFSVDEAVELSIASTVEDRRPIMSKLAVECLGLVGIHEPLVETLKRTVHEESRQAAVYALRVWLPLVPENREKLRQTLAKTFTPTDADIVYRLLWGFNAEDAANPVTSEQLVTWMDHDEIAVRELAFLNVFRLTDKKFDYRANIPPEQRKSAINRWRQHLKNNGGALVPKA